MLYRMIPAYCAGCGAAIPRAAAGRCPSCRVEFAPAGAGPRLAPRRTAPGDPGRDKATGIAPHPPRRLP